MKIDRYDLSSTLRDLKNVVPKKSAIQALAGILVKDGYLIASDGEITVKKRLEGTEGQLFVLPPKSFGLIDSLPPGEVDISYKDDQIRISMGAIKNKFLTFPAKDFAYDKDDIEGCEIFRINAMSLRTRIKNVLYAIPTSGANPKMGSICIRHKQSGLLEFTGLDSARIAQTSIETDNDNEFSFMILKKNAQFVADMSISGDVNVSINGNIVQFKSESCTIQTRRIDGEYFNTDQMFSSGDIGNITLMVPREPFCEALNRAVICGSIEEKQPVILDMDDGNLNISFQGSEAGCQDDIPAKFYGNRLRIGFSPKYLMEALKQFDSERVICRFAMKKAPVIITSEDSTSRALVLPVNFIDKDDGEGK